MLRGRVVSLREERSVADAEVDYNCALIGTRLGDVVRSIDNDLRAEYD